MKLFTKLMMVSLTLLVGISVSEAGSKKPETGPLNSMVEVWEAPEGLDVPESVMYDTKKRVLYVSNISGKPTLKNGQGFIARVKLDGTVKTPVWVAGLNAPKGMGIIDDTLYVTDIDRVVAINIPNAAIKKIWDVEGAEFLNDIAIGNDGRIFISDMVKKRLHVIKGGQLDLFLTLDYKKPNGLVIEGDTLCVGTAEGLLNIDLHTKTIVMAIEHQGGIDGVKPIGEGRYLVSDWKGKVQIIEKGQMPVVMMDTSADKINAADFEYIPEKNLVIIPTFFDNRIVAYQLR